MDWPIYLQGVTLGCMAVLVLVLLIGLPHLIGGAGRGYSGRRARY